MFREHGSGRPAPTGGLVTAFNPHLRTDSTGGKPWRGFAAQFVLVTTAALLYFSVRLLTKGAEVAAFAHAETLLRFERWAGINIELWAQAQILDSESTVTFFNWVYIWMHWPVIIGVLVWLYRYNKSGFVLFRNALILSGAIGLAFFVSYPVAPPRFLDGFSDTVGDLSTSFRYMQSPTVVNEFAAMPSLHVGWNLLAGIMLFRVLPRGPVRLVPLLSPVLMTMAVVFTANHYVVDVVAGVAVALGGLHGAKLLTGRIERRVASPPRPATVALPH